MFSNTGEHGRSFIKCKTVCYKAIPEIIKSYRLIAPDKVLYEYDNAIDNFQYEILPLSWAEGFYTASLKSGLWQEIVEEDVLSDFFVRPGKPNELYVGSLPYHDKENAIGIKGTDLPYYCKHFGAVHFVEENF
jgi:hypothetical protein